MPLKRDATGADPFALNLTPMIDVVFLLVIFFMSATQFAEVERAVELELPTVGSEGTSVAAVVEPRVVSVTAAGEITLDGEVRSIDELKADLTLAKESAASDAGPAVLIHGDARCDFQHIAAALTACRAAGIADVGVSVDTAEETIRR
ncbi:ExbD/TolR family protein [Botrimarina mediterranea]|uniref:Colicin uptake protein TolR n=1 Tax=Botrimarina mediterranea TaxID=2528022 RepID=A0A518KC44_9BACT|nr:biopolymer transporter ExbD [Botrimarina mediterranea]QDV75370.1 colicin uptake protein TolR [Botrimarina mediterranea]QDV80040.1 colicin uptake protein TolR [Planctomycetes bacterium K2D]